MAQPSILAYPAEELRRAGRQALESIIHYEETLRGRGPIEVTRRQTLAGLCEDLPRAGRPFEQVLARLEKEVLPYMARPSHPRFFAFVPSPSNAVGALAAFLAAGWNVFCGSWMEGAGPTMIELVTLDWLKTLTGFPDQAGGLFLSGGSMANLTALAAARDTRLGEQAFSRGVVYYSDQTHSSVERALRVLGFTRKQMRKVPSDDDLRMPVAALRDAIVQDRMLGWRPFCVVANAGTTNTGAVDPLAELSDLCRTEDLWLHVDGAFGAAAVLCPEGRSLLAGLGEADSLTLDPHKWLFQPFDCGCVLVRDQRALLDTFSVPAEYLADVAGRDAVDFWDCGIELTRPFRALKLWMTFEVFGVDAVAASIERGFELARIAERELRGRPDWKIVTPASMAVVSFRYQPFGVPAAQVDAWNREIGLRVTESGTAAVLSTSLRGRPVLRMCTISPRTTEEDIRETVKALDETARRMADVH
jgi:glutamate/tyrosine decarboxylase-like PLP-dependent enzyme